MAAPSDATVASYANAVWVDDCELLEHSNAQATPAARILQFIWIDLDHCKIPQLHPR